MFVKGMRENWESRQRLKNRWATPSGTFPGITNHRNRNPMSRSAVRQPREWETAGHLSSRERRIQGWVRIRFRKSDGQREGKPKKKRKEHLFARQSRGLSAFPDINCIGPPFPEGNGGVCKSTSGAGARQFRRMKSAAAKHRYHGERGAVLKQQHG